MCGIAGVWSGRPEDDQALARLAQAMGDAIAHRGPDDSGVWTEPSSGLALVNRRLAIIDLSPGGHQPMLSADGRFALVTNGEIYNHRELRRRMEGEGVRFRSHSDTEVLVEAVARWGVDRALESINGMFAMAVWDVARRHLTLARDRMGEKPLYWTFRDGLLLFGSELKALRPHPAFRPALDRAALASMLRLGYVPAPSTIYAGVQQLAPGGRLDLAAGGTPHLGRYWSLEQVALAGLADPLRESESAVVEQAERLLGDAVRSRLLSDVPLGLFLSGGIDSSVVLAMMRQGGRPVRSFSIGFREAGYDESADAARVAAHLGADHTALTVTAADALELIPRLPDIYDEPFADSSQIPTYLLCRLARPSVTVALSGDGGDELFAGYNRHVWAGRVRAARRAPGPLRKLAAAGLKAVPPARWDQAAAWMAGAPRQLGDKVHKLAGALAGDDFYFALAAPGEPLLEDAVLPDWRVPSGLAESVAAVQLLDGLHYLPDDVLTKVDRASMAVSLEVRAPLLDHRLVEFVWRLPADLRVRDGQGKWLLRQVLARHVPAALTDRPKAGFSVPLDAWLRGPLRDWAEALLAPPRLRALGICTAPVAAAWARHLAGSANLAERLWAVLMLVAWAEAMGS